eukprot:UN04987
MNSSQHTILKSLPLIKLSADFSLVGIVLCFSCMLCIKLYVLGWISLSILICVVLIVLAIVLKNLDFLHHKCEQIIVRYLMHAVFVFYQRYFGILKETKCNDICVICQERLTLQKCVLLKCGHIFHELCIIMWERKQVRGSFLFRKCVICRTVYDVRDRSKGHSHMDQ